MGSAHADADPHPREGDRTKEYRKAYHAGKAARGEHPDWVEKDALDGAYAYCLPHRMHDQLAMALWDGYYHGAMGMAQRDQTHAESDPDGSTAPRERIQLDCSPEAIQHLDSLTAQIGALTRAGTIRQALRLLAWIIEEIPEESTLQVLDPHGEQRSTIEASLLRFAIHPTPGQGRPPQEEELSTHLNPDR